MSENTTTEELKPSAAEEKQPSATDALLNEGDLVADYLEELLDIADLDGDIENSVVSGRAHVVIDTEDESLVGPDGEVLEALQELARLVVMTETGNRSRLTLDVAGYREKRRVELVALAKDAIAAVLETGEPVRMAPLNAYERKIVHDEVAAAGLVSESEGEPPHRRVVVSK
ncbi:single-stranded DNA-binding protein [Tessaracoccus sp. OS52]|uniref:Jag family protein n=1 Tax=Tessaracoccus sp. OS52 TaxID=2886691 RepID=UPI001D11A562|nr:R3H domain-containing nucleic acid-binding protein [Tessaracoccus sp. OS52]MCC2593818.1 single-stranded DNA-binding protein [Tessaracoccus sp. OS52]